MPARPANDYQPFNQTGSTVAETASPSDYLSVHATPEDFGSQVGNALQGAGKQVQQVGAEAGQIAEQFGRMATESRVNDDYANKYAPQAAQLRANYDKLEGQDKVAGIGDYLAGLNKLGQSFVGDEAESSPYYKQAMGQLISRHIFAETDGANRELVASQKQFAADSQYDMIQANSQLAVRNYNNPGLVNDLADRNDAHVLMQHIDAGHDPNNPQSANLIQYKQENVKADMATGMINQAVASGDAETANKIRAAYSPVIPGYKQIQLDSFLHSANMQQTGEQGVTALTSGQPLPQTVGAPPSHVQSIVANMATAGNVDPNAALAVLRIESANGQNMGSRGTLGQDKATAGQPLDVQAKALCDNLRAGTTQATQALGRPAEGWEGYVAYQQGAGGGPALLKANQSNPNAKAIDVLEPLYKNPQDAMEAIVKNGGNVSMSVSDFLNQEKQKYNDSFDRAKCNFGNSQIPGDAISAPHETPGPTVQPGANPMQDLRNWNRANELTLTQIQAIPNVETRQRLLEVSRQKTAVYEAKANAYKGDLVNQASQLAQDPKFTSMAQITPDMHASLLEASPSTLSYMESRAEYNLNHQAGVVTKDQKEYGDGYKNILNDVWNGKITSTTELHQAVGDDKLTIAGYDRISKELVSPKDDPAKKASELAMQKASFDSIEASITHGVKTPQSAAQWASTLPSLYAAIDDRKSHQIPAGQYYDPTNKEFIGNDVKALQMPKSQAVSSQIEANKSVVKERTLADIISEAKQTTDAVKKAQLRQEFLDRGGIIPSQFRGSAVPLAGGQ